MNLGNRQRVDFDQLMVCWHGMTYLRSLSESERKRDAELVGSWTNKFMFVSAGRDTFIYFWKIGKIISVLNSHLILDFLLQGQGMLLAGCLFTVRQTDSQTGRHGRETVACAASSECISLSIQEE